MDYINIIIATSSLVILSIILGVSLALADKYLAVVQDERLETLTKMLPGVNCGSCGYPGCSGFAAGLLAGEIAVVSKCRPSKTEARVKIAEYLAKTPDPSGKTISVKAE